MSKLGMALTLNYKKAGGEAARLDMIQEQSFRLKRGIFYIPEKLRNIYDIGFNFFYLIFFEIKKKI